MITKYTRKKNDRFLLVVALAGLAIMLLLGFMASRAHAETLLFYYESTPSWHGLYNSGVDYDHYFTASASGVIDTIDIQTYADGGTFYTGQGMVFQTYNGSSWVNASSVLSPFNGYTDYTGKHSFDFSSYGISLVSGTQYRIHYTGAYSSGYSRNVDSNYLRITALSSSASIVVPAYSYSGTGNAIDFEFSLDLISAGSYNVRLFYTKEGQYNAYANANGLSVASAGTYSHYFTLDNLDAGTYTDFRVALYNSSGQQIFISDIATYVGGTIEIQLTGTDTGGFGGGEYYTGSSTAFYSDNLPALFSDNGLTEPSSFYTDLTGIVDNILNKIYGIAGGFSSFFSNENARSFGQTVNTQTVAIWGYVNDFDNFMGGYPYAFTIFMAFLFMIAMLVLKLIKTVLLR